MGFSALVKSLNKSHPRLKLEDRLEKCTNPLLRKLLGIMIAKRTNLCVAVNFSTIEDLLECLDKVGPHVCIIKTQTLRLAGVPSENLRLVSEKKKEHNFLIFEDHKFCDGGETVAALYEQLYVQFADLVTVLPLLGDGIFKAISETAANANLPNDEPRSCIGLCEFSFSGCLPMDAKRFFQKCCDNKDACCAIVAQKLEIPSDLQSSFVKMTPGVHMEETSDGMNQQWNHPAKVVKDLGADIIIVGRGIVSKPKDQWESLAIKYKDEAYNAYLESCKHSN